jgi:uncharacterized protein (TIGR02598 family)
VKTGALKTIRNPRRTRANTLVEVMVAVGILSIMMASLYSAFNTGFGSIRIMREDMRATQVMTQKLEAIRLLTWQQMSNCPSSFVETYDPQGLSTSSNTTSYYCTLSLSDVATNIPSTVSYRANLHLITVTVAWTNGYNSGTPLAHFRQMQTISDNNGLQAYIYGN